ncbi:MAG TPA: hypothetical protein VLJ76_11485 [Gaiellaceae bacterium]|nr:hypothetical protein [Gaiellaceae bacterium]
MAARSDKESRGTERLLRDCAVLGRLVAAGRPAARVRLDRELGARLARELEAVLARPRRD